MEQKIRRSALTDTQSLTRGDETREKLLQTAIDIFGRQGYDAVSTRMISSAAGVNLQAIPYYYKSKEGLYLAAAEHIAARIGVHVAPALEQIRARLGAVHSASKSAALEAEEARLLLTQLLSALAGIILSDESAAWARFIVREQMEPTEAFEHVYATLMKPMLDTIRELLAPILQLAAGTKAVRLRAVALVGHVLVFRMAHEAALRQLQWKSVGPKEVAAVRQMIRQVVASISAIDS